MMENEKIINDYIKCYLCGPMESVASGDGGRRWRDKLRPELESRIDKNNNPIYVFNPCDTEKEKVGYSIEDFHDKLHGWVASGCRDKVKEYMDIIWRGKTFLKLNKETGKEELTTLIGDIDYTRYSNFIILKIEEGSYPVGTYGECMIAYERNIPIYMIQTIPLTKYSKTLLGWIFGSGGEIFKTQKELLEFLDKKYKLKVKK
ncbi:MAG: hypothetical protein ACTSWE_09395 [Promethearchaeota archaeon]